MASDTLAHSSDILNVDKPDEDDMPGVNLDLSQADLESIGAESQSRLSPVSSIGSAAQRSEAGEAAPAVKNDGQSNDGAGASGAVSERGGVSAATEPEAAGTEPLAATARAASRLSAPSTGWSRVTKNVTLPTIWETSAEDESEEAFADLTRRDILEKEANIALPEAVAKADEEVDEFAQAEKQAAAEVASKTAMAAHLPVPASAPPALLPIAFIVVNMRAMTACRWP